MQNFVNLLVEASMQDPAEFSFSAPPPTSPGSALSPTLAPSHPTTLNGTAIQPSSPVPSPMFPNHEPKHLQPPRSPDSSKRRSSGHGPSKHLKIEDRNFFAVSATLEVLVLLTDYLRVIVNLPTLVTETMSRVIELLKAFNSRTCQVVLGAGAMRSAGLKNITAKHLGKYPPLRYDYTARANCIIGSTCLSVSVDHDLSHSLCARNVQTASEPKAGCHAH